MASIANLTVRIGAEIGGLTAGVANASKQLNAMGDRLTSVGKTLSTQLTAPIVAFAGLSVRAFGQQEQAERKLAAAIRATGGAVDSNMDRFKSFATEMQRLTVVGDETTLALLQVATSSGLSAEQAERAARNAISMQSAFGTSARAAIRMAAALEQGDATMLRRYIPTLRGVTDSTEAVSVAQRVLAESFDIAKEEAKTSTGQIQQLQNAFGDFMESVGSVIAEAITPFILRLTELSKRMQALDDSTRKTIIIIGLLAASAGPLALGAGMALKMAAAIRTLTIAMAANPYTAIGVGILALATYAAMARSDIDKLSDSLMAQMGISDIVDADDATATIARVRDEITELYAERERLADSIASRPGSELALSNELEGIDNQIAALQRVLIATANIRDQLTNTSDVTNATDDIANSVANIAPDRPITESILPEDEFADIVRRIDTIGGNIDDLLDVQYNAPDLLFPPGSLGAVRNELNDVTQALEGTTDAGKIVEFQDRIKSLNQTIANWGKGIKKVETSAIELGDALKSQIADSVTSFATTLGNAFTGDAGASGFFGNLLSIFADFASQFGKIMIAIGIAKSAISFSVNPLTTIAAGVALVALGSAAKNLLDKGPATSVNDALITSSGKVVKFHPDDNILAMKDFGNLQSNPVEMMQSGMDEGKLIRALNGISWTLRGDQLYATTQRGGIRYER